MGKKRVFILVIIILRFTRFTPERQEIILPNISKPKETPSNMINIKSSQVFLLDSLAVPRLGNVQLRFHFLRRGTSEFGQAQLIGHLLKTITQVPVKYGTIDLRMSL